MKPYDLLVIGGGIVGLATAYQFSLRHPGKRVGLVEKEAHVAEHQTGRNSGVLHSGIYYKPGSLKAVTCRAGKTALETFCKNEGVAFERCGKVIVAVQESDRRALHNIFARGQANGIDCSLIDRARLMELEPHVIRGVEAIHVPETGIVDYRGVCDKLAEKIRHSGGDIHFGTRVVAIHASLNDVTAETTTGAITTKQLVNCAGLYSDHVTRLSGQPLAAQIIPFRGEYFSLKPSARRFCRNLIYPTPDPAFPFLGVHFTRMVDGSVECGPNAVLAFGREAYSFFSFNLRELWETLTYRGFLRMAVKHWRMGLDEMQRSLSKSAFVHALQRLIPEIQAHHLEAAPAGIRAQAVSADGTLVDDFLIVESERVVNVCNAPSPAATASLQIGSIIANQLTPRFD